jgi:hypothetical protein
VVVEVAVAIVVGPIAVVVGPITVVVTVEVAENRGEPLKVDIVNHMTDDAAPPQFDSPLIAPTTMLMIATAVIMPGRRRSRGVPY